MMPAGRSGSLTFVNLSSASSLFSNPSPPVSGGGPPLSGGAMMAPMSGGGGMMAPMAPMSRGSTGGMPPLMPNVVSPAGHQPNHHQAQGAYPLQASPMGSWGFPPNAVTSLQAPLQPAVLHQPQHQGMPLPMPMQPQPVYQPQQHPPMQPQAPFSLGGPPGSQGPYGHHLPSPLQPTPVGGHPAAQHQQHLAYGGGGGGLHYASPPTSHGSGGSPSHSSYSSPPSSTSSSSTSSPSPSSTSTMMAGGVGFGYGGVGSTGGGGNNGSFRLDEAQERMRQQHEQIRAEERLKQQQLHVKMLQEEQQRHLREEQERERIEAEKRKAEREALRQEEERKRLEAQREQERQQEALRAEQMRIFEEVRQAQLRLQQEQELQHQRQQLDQFEQQQKMIQEQQRQQEQLRLERIRFEEEQRREEEAARLQQEKVKQEEERKRQDLLRQEQLRQEQFALEQKRREDALQEKRRQEQLLLAQQEKLRREQEEVEQEKLRAEQRLNSERMQQEKERLAEEVRQQQERLRLAQEEIQREKEKMAIELMREQQRIQEERLRLQAEHEKLRQERMERERLEEESRVRHQERVRQHQEQLLRQQEAIRQQQQQQVAHLRQQQEQMMRSQAQPQPQPQPQAQAQLPAQAQVSRTQTAPILSRRPTPQVPPVPTNASSWSPFGPVPSSSSAEERPGEMKPRPRASVGSAILSRPPPHGSGTGSPNKASTLDSPFGGTSAAGGSAIHQRPISPPNTAQQGERHARKPRHPGAPAPIGSQQQKIQADAMASYEAYAAEIARKHRVSDRAEIMTADTMFDSSAFENKLDLYGDHNEQRSAYYDDSSDDENGLYNKRGSETNPPQPRSGSILGVRSQKQPTGRTLTSHKTGPAATSGSAVPPKRVPKPMVALRTGPAGAPSHWEKDAGAVKAKDVPGARPLPCPPGAHNRRRSTGSAEGEDGDDLHDDDNNNEKNGGNAEKKGGLRALVKHHTGALKRSPRAPIYNDAEPQQRSAGSSNLNASVDSAHARIEELQEVTGHREEGQPRSAPLPRAVRQFPTPSHTSPPPATPPRSASKSLPPVPIKSPSTAAPAVGRQLPPKKAPLPPVPRKALSREEAALILQTRWRSSRLRRQYTQITLRTRVAREIYSSELVYVQSLGVTIDVFLKPLRRAAEQSKPIILSADIASVFGNLEEIYAYHLQMVSKLESRIARWNVETQIGDTFLDMKQDFIMLYSSYINHYDQALETIGRCKDLKTWRAFIQRCNQHPECGGLSLESFLILPVQRVTRYVILLRDLRQKTPENHVDYQNINAAQTYMDNICYQVNENKRSAENLKKQMDVLASLQAKMKPKDMVRDLVDQNRVFVKQVVVTLYDQDSDKRREVCLFVFNDQLLVTKGDIKKDRFQIIAKFTRDDINFRLEIMADTDDFMGQQIKNAFVLHTPRVSYLFFCISAEERNLLFEQIRTIFR